MRNPNSHYPKILFQIPVKVLIFFPSQLGDTLCMPSNSISCLLDITLLFTNLVSTKNDHFLFYKILFAHIVYNFRSLISGKSTYVLVHNSVKSYFSIRLLKMFSPHLVLYPFPLSYMV